jgi:GNAT superfamily N-acetyltransferase
VFVAPSGESALLFSPEGTYLAGRADDPDVNADLRRLIADTITTFGDDVLLVPGTAAWADVLAAVCPVPLETIARRFYVTESATPILAPPEGFTVRRIDADLLADTTLDLPGDLTSGFLPRIWAASNFGSVEAFLAHGFGYCAVEGAAGVAASWSLTDAVADGRCEIGIYTREAYRRRGLAAAVVTAMVWHAFTDAGLTAVGWHCDEANTASWRTAARAGLRPAADYVQYRCTRASAE